MGSFGHGGALRPWATGLTVTTVLLLAAVSAAEASTANIRVNKRCYVNRAGSPASMTVVGRGFYPGDGVLITSSDHSVDARATASPRGTITATIEAPTPHFRRPGKRAVTLTASDFTVNGTTISARTTVMVAPLAVETLPIDARLSQNVTWLFSGFRPGSFIFAHYLHDGSQIASARFGHATGRCGILKVNGRLFPDAHPPLRRYKVQIDDSAVYTSYARPRVLTTVGRR